MAQEFLTFIKNNMNKTHNQTRNKPAEEGQNNDPGVRDDSAIQPGVQTITGSDYDKENEQLTDTAQGDYSERKDKNADPRFDEDKEE